MTFLRVCISDQKHQNNKIFLLLCVYFTVHCYVSSVCGDGVRGSLLRTSWERGSASEAARKRSKINVFSPHLLTGGHQIQ